LTPITAASCLKPGISSREAEAPAYTVLTLCPSTRSQDGPISANNADSVSTDRTVKVWSIFVVNFALTP
jgi:hypothetical protein